MPQKILHWVNRFFIYYFIVSQQVSSECICSTYQNQTKCLNVNSKIIDNAELPIFLEIKLKNDNTLPINSISIENQNIIEIRCNITKLEQKSFANQDVLKELNLGNNFISVIPNDFFEPMKHLEKFNMSHNIFENPTLDTFFTTETIRTLDVSYNNISQIQLGVFDEMKNLEQLYLQHNILQELELGIFDEIRNLILLDLSYNKIKNISINLLDQTEKLQEINLSGNKFTEVFPLGTFDNLKQVKVFKLSDCKIEVLLLGIFDEVEKLIMLDLSKNKIEKLSEGIFDTLKNLKEINLESCNLDELSSNIFGENTKLEKVYLANNNLTILGSKLFENSNKLKYLNLSYNELDQLPTGIFQNTSLFEVDLSNNLFKTFQPELLNLVTLERIHLQINKINILHELTFKCSIDLQLKYLDLRNNRLVFMDTIFFYSIPNLRIMEILGNPWDCKCLKELENLMNQKDIEYTIESYYDNGEKPICIEGRYKNICYKNVNELDEYYDIYKQRLLDE